VYKNPYTSACHSNTQVQVDFLSEAFANSKATWKFLQLHHSYMSSSTNETDLAPLISVVEKHHGIVLNGHDHCLGHYFFNNTNFILSGAAGYPQAGDCNNGVALGPYAKFLGANNLTGKFPTQNTF
jgi:tartrate-resistant acid phosphatase type 5